MKLSRKLSAAVFAAAALLGGLTTRAHAQAEIDLGNLENTSTNSAALTNGLFWIKTNSSGPVLINQDFNAAFYAGTNSTNLSIIGTFLLTDGTATGDDSGGPGTFLDPSGTGRNITGATNSAFFQIQAWTGNYTNYSSAAAAGAYAARSAVFSNSVAGPPSVPPDLTGMPAIVLVAGGSGNSLLGGGGSSSGGNSSPSSPSGPLDVIISSNTCGLWLSVTTSNTTATLTLHNTRQSETYLVWSSQAVNAAFTNWGLEATVLGSAGNTTQTNIAMGSRADLFFQVTEDREYVTNAVFQGLNYSNLLSNPPDTMGAVGPSNFVELLNGKISIYDKSGVVITQTTMINFFSVSYNGTNYPTGSPMDDPRMLYDFQSQRWVASALDPFGSGQVILAVSTNASPTNLITGWKRYVIPVAVTGAESDFDTLGLDSNGIYLSVLHAASSNAFHRVIAIKKPDIYNGTYTGSTIDVSTNELLAWTIQPAVNFDNVASDGYAWFVAKGAPELGSNYQGGAVLYRRLQWSGTNASWADTNWFTISANTNYQDYYDFDGTNTTVLPANGISAPQSNGTVILYYVGSRLAATTIRNGFLWTCQAIGLSTNGTYVGDSSGSNVTRSAMQWFKLQISVDSTSLSLAEHGRFFDTNQTDNAWWYYFPSLMVNCAGDMVAGFSGSTATNYIGAFYTWRLGSGATLAQPQSFQPGTTGPTPNRWGDYSATTLDPTDDWTFWTVQEYARPNSGNPLWGTVIGKIRPSP